MLADSLAIQKALNLKFKPSRVANPEALLDAKRELKQIVFNKSGNIRRFISTVHNEVIARKANLVELRRCASFRPLESFIKGL